MPEANAGALAHAEQRKKNSPEMDFFSEYGDANRYKIQEIIGKGSYGVVCSAIDQQTANVYHRDLKPKNILANANCKLKICDFGLARVAFNDSPTTVFWTDYVATRWYRAPELCGSFFTKYSPAIDMWSIGCIFAEILTGKPLFPGKNVVHQLDLMTDLLGTPSADTISQIRNEKARRYLSSMRKKQPIPFSLKFPNADPSALKLLQRLLAFDPKDRPTAEEALADPYFKGIAKVEREPSCQPISKMEFEFERRKFTKEDVKELIFQEILEYHPQLLKDYKNGSEKTSFLYPSAVDNFRRQFASLEENGGRNATVDRKHVSLPRTTTVHSTPIPAKEGPAATSQVPQRIPTVLPFENASAVDQHITRRVARNPGVPPATNNSSVYGYHLKSDSSDRQDHQLELEKDQMQYRPGQHAMEAKVAPELARDMRPSLYYVSRGVPKTDLTERAALQRSMLHNVASFNGITAVAGGYSKAGILHYGVTSLY
ncbi:hypothetical protein PVAP13_3KG308800 [Panicum virgatum]|uniref:mitogen-activated protein kinase n=1 Tax=Panicum virgatum TaxID=38727 RepID=A0A8T0USP3_PANVG|nr:hypothetical protein PVAP13_3KG308800 [Panicum virgatum]